MTTGRLIPGQFARVRMGQPKQQTLVMIDERAIGTDQDKKFVMAVGDDNRAVYRPITLGGTVDGLRIVDLGPEARRPHRRQRPAARAPGRAVDRNRNRSLTWAARHGDRIAVSGQRITDLESRRRQR